MWTTAGWRKPQCFSSLTILMGRGLAAAGVTPAWAALSRCRGTGGALEGRAGAEGSSLVLPSQTTKVTPHPSHGRCDPPAPLSRGDPLSSKVVRVAMPSTSQQHHPCPWFRRRRQLTVPRHPAALPRTAGLVSPLHPTSAPAIPPCPCRRYVTATVLVSALALPGRGSLSMCQEPVPRLSADL